MLIYSGKHLVKDFVENQPSNRKFGALRISATLRGRLFR
jgi:hypothetical protein